MKQGNSLKSGRKILCAVPIMGLLASQALAQAADPIPWQLNMGKGVTHTARMAWEAHMVTLWICAAIGLIVYAALIYAIFKFRKSKGAVAAQFSHNSKLEFIWTAIPVIILFAMTVPATAKLIAMYDTRDAELTIKITGYQWMWKYEYIGKDVAFFSRITQEDDVFRQSGKIPTLQENPHYLLDVDNSLVLPVDTKVRIILTSDDVIHSWWVPALGWKQDAVPGFITERWTQIETIGTYRGQCAELCGKDHGFMPVVVKAVSKEQFSQWLAARTAATDI